MLRRSNRCHQTPDVAVCRTIPYSFRALPFRRRVLFFCPPASSALLTKTGLLPLSSPDGKQGTSKWGKSFFHLSFLPRQTGCIPIAPFSLFLPSGWMKADRKAEYRACAEYMRVRIAIVRHRDCKTLGPCTVLGHLPKQCRVVGRATCLTTGDIHIIVDLWPLAHVTSEWYALKEGGRTGRDT